MESWRTIDAIFLMYDPEVEKEEEYDIYDVKGRLIKQKLMRKCCD